MNGLRLGFAQIGSQVLNVGVSVDLVLGGAKTSEVAERAEGKSFAALSAPFTFGNSVECEVQWEPVREIIRAIRGQGLGLVLGGGGFTLEPEVTMDRVKRDLGPLAEGVIGVEGEGDQVIQKLVLNGGKADGIAGLWRIEGGRTIPGKIQTLSSQELADLKPVDPRLATISFEAATRGCPSRCNYCSSCNLTKRGVRKFTPESFVEKLQTRIFDSGNYQGYIVDNNALALGMGWWYEAKNLLQREDLLRITRHLCMGFSVNPEQVYDLSLEDLGALKQMGIGEMIIGVQSFDPDILRRNNRPPVDAERLMRFCERCYEAGIYVELDMIFGLPTGTTDEDLISKKADLDIFHAFMFAQRARVAVKYRDLSIIPGSQLHREGYDGSESYKGSLHSSRLKFLFAYLQWRNMFLMTDEERFRFDPLLSLSNTPPVNIVKTHGLNMKLGGQIISAICKSQPDMIPKAKQVMGFDVQDPTDMLRSVLESEEIHIRTAAAMLSTGRDLPPVLRGGVRFREQERVDKLRKLKKKL